MPAGVGLRSREFPLCQKTLVYKGLPVSAESDTPAEKPTEEIEIEKITDRIGHGSFDHCRGSVCGAGSESLDRHPRQEGHLCGSR